MSRLEAPNAIGFVLFILAGSFGDGSRHTAAQHKLLELRSKSATDSAESRSPAYSSMWSTTQRLTDILIT